MSSTQTVSDAQQPASTTRGNNPTNWLGRTLQNASELKARQSDIDAMLMHKCLRDRQDLPALASCCAVLSSSYRQGDDFHPQAVLKLPHYHAWCEFLGLPESARNEQTAIEVMALWVDRCKRAPTPDPQ